MEEFLKDSPTDFNNPGTNNTNSGSPTQRFDNYSNQDIGFDFNSGTGGYPQQFDQQNYQNDQLTGTAAPVFYNEPEVNAQDFTNGNNQFQEHTHDPFLDDLEELTFPHTTATSNYQQLPQQFVDPTTTSNLDEIISPPANNNNFLNPSYFSPPTRTNNFNSLNSIAEDENLGINGNGGNTFSPSRPESGSYSFNQFNEPDIQSGSYLSPQNNLQYLSPNAYDSFDTFRSPSTSYLNSPPQYHHVRVPSNGQTVSSSIPSNFKADPTVLLSPPNSSNISTSVPSSGTSREALPTKQLTKEEKLKRRREFHNAVERRRRDLIKERIKELGLIIPPSLLNPQLSAVQILQRNSNMNSNEVNDLLASIKVKESKPNKSTILNKSVDYINHLKYVLDEQDKTRDQLTGQIEKLQRKLGTTGLADEPVQSTQTTNSNSSSTNIGTTSSSDTYFNPDDFFLDMIGSTNTTLGGSSSGANDYLG